MAETRLAESLFDSLGLKGFGAYPSTKFVILLEFVAAQVMNPTLYARNAPVESLVGAVYYFSFRRAVNRGTRQAPRHWFLHADGVSHEENVLLQLVDKHSHLSEAEPAALARALFWCIGIFTDPCCGSPEPEAVIEAEFLSDKQYYNPTRAFPAKTLEKAVYNSLRRRCRFPALDEGRELTVAANNYEFPGQSPRTVVDRFNNADMMQH